MKRISLDGGLAIGALAIGAIYLALARAIPGEIYYDPVGPRIFPTLVALGILGCGALILLEARSGSKPEVGSVRPVARPEGGEAEEAGTQPRRDASVGAAPRAAAPLPDASADPVPRSPSRIVVIGALMAGMAVYATVLETIGYFLTTAAFMFAVTSFFNRGKHVQNAVVSVAFSGFVYYSFTEFLRIGLPRGLLTFL